MSPDLAGYEALAASFERELALVAERDFDGRAELIRARAQLTRSLPPVAPATARPVLERCVALQQRVRVEMLRVREAILLELGQVRHGQRAASGYAPARRRALRIDASA